MYEELRRRGTMDSLPGRVLAVEITNRGRSYEAFYFVYGRTAGAIGRHRDELVREDGRWRFQKRRGFVDIPSTMP